MQLQLITIDFWNTIFDSSNGAGRNEFRYQSLINELSHLDVHIPYNRFQNAIESSWGYFNNVWKTEYRTPSTGECIEFFWNYLELPKNWEAMDRLADAFANSILHSPPSLIDGVSSALEELKLKYKLAIVSDTGFSPGIVLRKLLHNNKVYDYFDAFSFSDETGYSKPHEIAFRTVLNKLNVLPQNALHIGDIEDTDIKGAKMAGMKAIRFNGDKTAFLRSENAIDTQADAEANSWSEILAIIEKISNNKEVK